MHKRAVPNPKKSRTNVLDIGSFGSRAWGTYERLASAKKSPFFLKAFSIDFGARQTNREGNLTVVREQGEYCSGLKSEPSGFYHHVHLHAPGGITTTWENGFEGFVLDIGRIMKPGSLLFASADSCFSVYGKFDGSGVRALYGGILPRFEILLSIFDKCLASGFDGGSPVGNNFAKPAMRQILKLFGYETPKDVRGFFSLFSENSNDMDYFLVARKK